MLPTAILIKIHVSRFVSLSNLCNLSVIYLIVVYLLPQLIVIPIDVTYVHVCVLYFEYLPIGKWLAGKQNYSST